MLSFCFFRDPPEEGACFFTVFHEEVLMRRQRLSEAVAELSRTAFALDNDHGSSYVRFIGLDRLPDGEIEVVFGLRRDVVPPNLTMVHAITIRRPNEQRDVKVIATFGAPTPPFHRITQEDIHLFGQMAYAFVGWDNSSFGCVQVDSHIEFFFTFDDETLVSQRSRLVKNIPRRSSS